MGTILIFGGTSPIAQALAGRFAQDGHDLVLLGRNMQALGGIARSLRAAHRVGVRCAHFDALELERHEQVLACVLAGSTPLDGVILCLGDVGDQARAESDVLEAKRIIDTNFTGVMSAATICARQLKRRRGGFICIVTSLAGDRGRQSKYFYGAAKAGLSIFAQGLRNRLSSTGVHVITVKPGTVRTAMTLGRSRWPALAVAPEYVARSTYRAIRRRQPVLYTPWVWRPIMQAIGWIPEPLFCRMKL